MAIQNYADNGVFAPRKIVAVLRTTSDELARSLGLGKDAIQRKDRIGSDRTQRRIRQMVEVLNKVEPRFGSALLAYAWYRSEPLAGFAGQTAMQLVQNNRADDVLNYIDAVDAGVPLSGEGAARFGGRFNRIGRSALYTSLGPETALREANQVGTLQPTTLVAYRADIGPLLDGRNAVALQPFSIAPSALADPAWRERMLSGKPVPTQDLAEAAILRGFAGILVPSFARGAAADALNLVLWEWEGQISLVDDDDRLGLRGR